MQDYTNEITAKVQDAVLEQYKADPKFQTDVKGLMNQLGFTYESMNKYLNDCVNIGISVKTALDCYVLTLQLK